MKPLCATPVFAFRANGSGFDLAKPAASEVNFRVMAGQLARIGRLNHLLLTGSYSVAQHAWTGASALLREGAPDMVAALFLLSSAHTAFLGIIDSPTTELQAAALAEKYGQDEATHFLEGLADIRAGWDAAIYEAANLPAPASWKRSWATVIQTMRERLEATEDRELLGEQADQKPGRRKNLPSVAIGRPWGQSKAEFAWLELLERLIGRERVADSGFIEHEFRTFDPANTSTGRKAR